MISLFVTAPGTTTDVGPFTYDICQTITHSHILAWVSGNFIRKIEKIIVDIFALDGFLIPLDSFHQEAARYTSTQKWLDQSI